MEENDITTVGEVPVKYNRFKSIFWQTVIFIAIVLLTYAFVDSTNIFVGLNSQFEEVPQSINCDILRQK